MLAPLAVTVAVLAALVVLLVDPFASHRSQPSAAIRETHTDVAGSQTARAVGTSTETKSPYARTLAPATLRAAVTRNLRGTVIDTQPLTAGLLFDVRSGKVLWSRAPERVLPIASLTKMMTALLVVANSKLGSRVLITKQALDYTGSGVGVLPRGKRVPERALLYGLLLPSGNDAAIALAQHVAGTQARFIALMNQQAQSMGLTCTHYTTVSGVIDRGNHSCAVDLAQLGHAVLTNPTLAKIVATGQVSLRFPIKGGHLYLYNNNPLLRVDFPGTVGVKTGYTEAAGMCLVAAVRRGNRWLGIVLLHSANWLTQAEALLNAGFAADAG